MRTMRFAVLVALSSMLACPGLAEKGPRTYRLLTRADFDGLVCAILLRQIGVADEVRFAHPKEFQDGRVKVTSRDILANVPYVPGCAMTFDHHASEQSRFQGKPPPNFILDLKAPSAARLVYDFYGGAKRFPKVPSEMMEAVDKANRASFGYEEILRPKGWTLLAYILDPRTGLDGLGKLKTTIQQMVEQLVEFGPTHSIAQILDHPAVKERADLYRVEVDQCIAQIRRLAVVKKSVVILDLRKEKTIRAGNRFLIYALNPTCNVSIDVLWGDQKKKVVLALGKSITNRTCLADLGALALQYGGGGHVNAASCQVAPADAERVLGELVAKLNAPR